ncbi:unnamed protein product [Peronospora belbahrii]|uniref:Uncharacterized protein n=1 Tax=Peronospora belbahrii TaxID=622444 RepID=A0AAU9KUP6_9STRA|nr:unnamed protein product [Peronospora belbahrii]CAH0516796.1 unnamed protein product [Peronospora belbahrii]
MKFFTALLITAAIATPNYVIGQTTTADSTEATMEPSTGTETTMNNSMVMDPNNTALVMDSMTSEGGDMLSVTATNATTGETVLIVGSDSSESGSGNDIMKAGDDSNVGDDSTSGTSGAISIQSVTLTATTVVVGLAAALFF